MSNVDDYDEVESATVKVLVTMGIIVFVVSFIACVLMITTPAPTCLSKSKVVSITSIDFRSATLMLDDGTTAHVYQATTKPGAFWCTKWDNK